MRGSTKVCLSLGLLFALVSLAWMVFLPAIVQRELRESTGFDFRVSVLKVDPFTGQVFVRGLSARNPPGYPSPDFVELRELRADVSVFSWMFSRHVVVNELDVDTERIAIIRRHDGKSNAGEFMAAFSGAGSAAPSAPGSRDYFVRKLHIRLGELSVEDFTGSKSDKKVYKLDILRQVDACCGVGEIGGLLRREGLYSSYLINWRLQRSQGLLDNSATKKRAATPTNHDARVSQLERENARLKARLRQAELVLDIQKKASEILGIPLKSLGNGGND